MKTNRHFIKAIVALAITLAFIMPVSANIANPINIKTENPVEKLVGKLVGWEEQASGFWEASRGINHICAVDDNIVWAVGYDGAGGGTPVQEFTRTINGGDLWEADIITTAPSGGDSAMIFALDADTGIHSPWVKFLFIACKPAISFPPVFIELRQQHLLRYHLASFFHHFLFVRH